MCVAASHSGGPHRRALRVRAQRVPNAPLHRAMHIPHGEADIGCVDVPARLCDDDRRSEKPTNVHIYIFGIYVANRHFTLFYPNPNLHCAALYRKTYSERRRMRKIYTRCTTRICSASMFFRGTCVEIKQINSKRSH